jgi:hypothetical protein
MDAVIIALDRYFRGVTCTYGHDPHAWARALDIYGMGLARHLARSLPAEASAGGAEKGGQPCGFSPVADA